MQGTGPSYTSGDPLTSASSDVALRRLRHRIRNDLQVMHSLLRLHARRSQESSVRAALDDDARRVRAIALAYESLDRGSDRMTVHMARYLRTLIGERCRDTAQEPWPDAAVRVADVSLPMGIAVPCGLIVGELLACRAWRTEERGDGISWELELSSVERGMRLLVRRSGMQSLLGDLAERGVFATEVVDMLVSQLEGNLKETRVEDAAMEVLIEFPLAADQDE